MKSLLLAAIIATGCVINENGETDAPPPCNQPVTDTTGLKQVCESADKTRGIK